jgi:hypothetical protein
MDLEDLFIPALIIGMVGVFILVACLIGFGVYADLQISHGTITVVEKIGAHGESGQYLIIASDDQVYTVADNLFQWKFDASDRYAALKVGKTYTVTFSGFRNHFLSMYKNILEFQEV